MNFNEEVLRERTEFLKKEFNFPNQETKHGWGPKNRNVSVEASLSDIVKFECLKNSSRHEDIYHVFFYNDKYGFFASALMQYIYGLGFHSDPRFPVSKKIGHMINQKTGKFSGIAIDGSPSHELLPSFSIIVGSLLIFHKDAILDQRELAIEAIIKFSDSKTKLTNEPYTESAIPYIAAREYYGDSSENHYNLLNFQTNTRAKNIVSFEDSYGGYREIGRAWESFSAHPNSSSVNIIKTAHIDEDAFKAARRYGFVKRRRDLYYFFLLSGERGRQLIESFAMVPFSIVEKCHSFKNGSVKERINKYKEYLKMIEDGVKLKLIVRDLGIPKYFKSIQVSSCKSVSAIYDRISKINNGKIVHIFQNEGKTREFNAMMMALIKSEKSKRNPLPDAVILWLFKEMDEIFRIMSQSRFGGDTQEEWLQTFLGVYGFTHGQARSIKLQALFSDLYDAIRANDYQYLSENNFVNGQIQVETVFSRLINYHDSYKSYNGKRNKVYSDPWVEGTVFEVVKKNQKSKNKEEIVEKKWILKPEDEKENVKLEKLKKGDFKSEKWVIKPITTYHALLDESNEMRHCVSSYDGYIENGRSYIYSLLKDERREATVELTKAGVIPKIKGSKAKPVIEEHTLLPLDNLQEEDKENYTIVYRVNQARKKCNAALTKEDKEILKQWASANNIIYRT